MKCSLDIALLVEREVWQLRDDVGLLAIISLVVGDESKGDGF